MENTDKPILVTFGLQPSHIEAIELEFKYWNKEEPKSNPKYMKYVWEKLGKELGWCPFTLCLYYFKHLESNNK